ncbi:uncharacterized protein LOC121050192 isoform X1 [Rosa chinensis]|nr:uncharacterized protein LOC121050192 isoform X1 [Rosa chinensis]XP_040365496.1 uncharacterized protein LOC121050192 isoform X1 [Rosa chinensis]
METVKKRGRTGYTEDARARQSDDCSESNPELELTPDPASNGKKAVRGKTTLQVIPTGESNRQSVEWNERGQPVGDFSKRFSSTVGVLVRETVPINIQTWPAVDDKTKNSIWGLLMQKYVVDLTHKTFILQQMGRLWRAWKSDLSTNIRIIVDSRRTKSETTRLLSILKPSDVPLKEWDEFVAERSSESWQEKSEKMKKIRAKQTLTHTMSRKGYARLEDDYKKENPGKLLSRAELWIKGHEQKKSKNEHVAAKIIEIQAKLDVQPPSEGHIPVKYDILSQVLGKERPGRVRGLGSGVTPSKVDAQLESSSWKQTLENKIDAMSERTKLLEDIILKMSQNGHGGGGDGENMHADPVGTPQNGHGHGEPGTGNSKSGQDSTQLSINDKCKLLNWEGTSEVVARGHISDIHPESKVHGYKLGPDCYRIAIEEVVMPDAVFYRSQPEFVTMEDALGSTVAWPIKYILCDN